MKTEQEELTDSVPLYSEMEYDDAFRTMEGKCDDVLIPFVNHMFGEAYDKTAVIKRLRNEQFVENSNGSKQKRITDSSFEITCNDVTKRYHIECESKEYDGSILVRMYEYDTQIAKYHGEQEDFKMRFPIPNSGILLLRAPKRVPDHATIEIVAPDDRVLMYDVEIVKVADYSIEDLFEKKLYMLIPYYIFNYETRLKEFEENEDSLEELLDKYRAIFDRLEAEQSKGNLSSKPLDAIMNITRSVTCKFTKNQSKVQRKVGEMMGGKILDLPCFKIHDEAKAEGLAEGRAEGEEERKKLIEENEMLRKEIEELKKPRK